MLKLNCITWNVHRAKGRDGKTDPARVNAAIGTVFNDLHPDILALQEADEECRPHAALLDMAAISAQTGLIYAHDLPALRWGEGSAGFLGTILFLHPRLSQINADVIDLPGHCHRGAIAVEARVENQRVRIMSAHLSLSQPLRIVQMRIIGQYLRRRPAMQTILLGDLNEWRPWNGVAFARKIVGTRLEGPPKRTFPAAWPLLPLDRILTDKPGHVENVTAVDHPDTNAASDHRPLFGVVTVP